MSTLASAPEKARSLWPEWTTISLFTAIVAFAIPFHEPWADEAQAWQLAGTLSLHDLFLTYIRYEGSPGLWHFLLWTLIRAHVSYAGLHWICGGIAVAATSLLVLKSPFPRYLKFVLPFTYFLLFQYAVVARSYVLVPILLYAIALCWKKSPLLLALLLGLLANVALHATVISAGLALVYAINRIREREPGVSFPWREYLQPLAILLAFYAFAIWTAWPPHDLGFKTSTASLTIALISRFLQLCRPWGLAILFWIAMAIWHRARCKLYYLLPVLFCAFFCVAVSASWWHVGLLYPLLVSLLWITWPPPGSQVSRPEAMGRIVLMAMATMQILWSAYALRFDHDHPYSPDRATAEFLQPFVRQGATIAVTYANDPDCHACRSVGILPYFDHNIFINESDAFWSWSTHNPGEDNFHKLLPFHPTVVVVEARTPHPYAPISLEDSKIELLTRSGYTFTYMFCGARPSGFQLEEKNCHLIFQRMDSNPPGLPRTQTGNTSEAR